MNLPVQVKWPPLLTRMPMSGQLYAISGSTWIPVPDDTVSADLPKYMTWERAQSLSEPSMQGAVAEALAHLWQAAATQQWRL